MNVPPVPGFSCDFSQLNLRLATKSLASEWESLQQTPSDLPGQNRWPRGQSGIATCNNERLLRGSRMLANESPPKVSECTRRRGCWLGPLPCDVQQIGEGSVT
jgi:hypothetical protein